MCQGEEPACWGGRRAINQTCSGIHVHTHTGTTQGRGRWGGALIFELGGGLLRNVFPIFCFPSTSADRTSVWAAARWSQRQQTQHLAKLSSFYPPSSSSVFLLACVFIAPFPLTQELFFFFKFFIPSLFSRSFLHFHWFLPCFWPVSPISLCLISSVLSNGSLGSFPYTTSLFLLASVHPNLITLSPHRSLL